MAGTARLPDLVRRWLACAAGSGMAGMVAERGLARCLRPCLAVVRDAGAFRMDAGAGWLHAAAAYGCILEIAMTDLTLGESQWLWLPESALFVWMAWAVHRLSPRASAGLLIASAGLWFMPEAVWIAARAWNQLEADQELLSFLLGKWIILWCSAFYFRKQWVKWIREHQTVQAAAADR